ncbi:acyloxyacyl hydrolase [Pseudobacter ginsenosidimutans]|uniref:Lipid A 3-O-deacylase PagL n=1 Tax=Pseudobacter ginsenosidimutans TaxID=661488 RepID=A0A4Q7N0A6_9BACT|nr:acyloxyacyl hydrolase [Pseudobacter ginsenosidimutans]QEC43609.1 acyloxyacyl hydrolase [Pseudobacter ginsenosidimutans]RZS75007.1 lipid A 3-O-deacylase PagL [Pseudobacter ginsenosidimutans]
MIKKLLKNFSFCSVLICVSHGLTAQEDNGVFSGKPQNQDSLFKARKALWLILSPEIAYVMSDGSSTGKALLDSSVYDAFNLRVGWQIPSPDTYSQLYRHQLLGVGFYYSTFHNKNFGKPMGLYGWFNIPFKNYDPQSRWRFGYYAAFGISFGFNPFDEATNPSNKYIGSRNNCYVAAFLNASYTLSPNWLLIGGAGFRHFSNSAFTLPNYGINMLPATISIAYRVNKVHIDTRHDTIPKFKPFFLANLLLSAGEKQYMIGGTRYVKNTLSAQGLYQFSYKFRAGLGADLFYAAGGQYRDSTPGKSKFSKQFSSGITINGEWVLRRGISVPLGIGFYLKRNEFNDENKKHYLRVGLRARFLKHYLAGITVKAHGGSSDVFEWHLGYQFHKDRNRYKRAIFF